MHQVRRLGKGLIFGLLISFCFVFGALGWAQQASSTKQSADIAYENGMRLLRTKDYRGAIEQFKRVEMEAPRLPQGYTGEGITLALMGKLRDSIELLQKALRIDPSYWVARRELGIVEWQTGHEDDAAKDLRAVRKLFPNDEPVNLILAKYDFKKGDYAQAAAEFAGSADEAAVSTPLSLMWAESLLKTGRREEAEHKLEALLLTPNLTPGQRFQLAWLLGKAGNYAKSADVFNSLPKDFAHPFRRDYGLALAYYNLGRYADSIRLLTALKTQNLLRPELFSLLGAAEERKGDTLKAYDAFREGIERFPRDDANYLNIATLSAQHYNYPVAEQVLTAGIQQIPNDDRLFLARGVVYTLHAKLPRAQSDYETALKLAPERPGNYVALGICNIDQDKYGQAQSVLEQGIARGLKDVLLDYFLADVIFRQGITADSPRYNQALDAVQAAIELDPQFPYSYLQRGRLELISNQVGAAITDLERARKLEPDSRTILYQLARAYERAGKKAAAAKLFASVSEASRQEAARFRKGKLVEIMMTVSGQQTGGQ